MHLFFFPHPPFTKQWISSVCGRFPSYSSSQENKKIENSLKKAVHIANLEKNTAIDVFEEPQYFRCV